MQAGWLGQEVGGGVAATITTGAGAGVGAVATVAVEIVGQVFGVGQIKGFATGAGSHLCLSCT